MKHSARQIADWFLSWGEQNDVTLTNSKLQKLLYYAQGHYLGAATASSMEPLFDDEIVAWLSGPVVRQVHYELQGFDYGPIDVDAVVSDDFSWDDFRDIEDLLQSVWNTYAIYEDYYLAACIRRETPWMSAFLQDIDNPVISVDLMQETFSINTTDKPVSTTYNKVIAIDNDGHYIVLNSLYKQGDGPFGQAVGDIVEIIPDKPDYQTIETHFQDLWEEQRSLGHTNASFFKWSSDRSAELYEMIYETSEIVEEYLDEHGIDYYSTNLIACGQVFQDGTVQSNLSEILDDDAVYDLSKAYLLHSLRELSVDEMQTLEQQVTHFNNKELSTQDAN